MSRERLFFEAVKEAQHWIDYCFYACGGNGSGEKVVQSLKNETNKLELLFNAIHERYAPEHKEALAEFGIDIFENLPQTHKYLGIISIR